MQPQRCRCQWMPADPVEILQQAIEQVQAIPDLDFVVFTGDLVDEADRLSFEQFGQVVSQLRVPYYFSVGNHDIDEPISETSAADSGVRQQGDLDTFNRADFLNWCRQHFHLEAATTGWADFVVTPLPGLRLMAMDASLGPCPDPQGIVRPPQLAWLQEQLDRYRDELVILAIHQPPLASVLFRNHRMLPDSARQLRAMLKTHRYVAAVLSGHLHTPKVYARRNTAFLTAPPLVGPFCAFRVIDLEAPISSAPDRQWGQLHYRWHPLQLANGKPKLMWRALARGRSPDREGSIPIAFPVNWGDRLCQSSPLTV